MKRWISFFVIFKQEREKINHVVLGCCVVIVVVDMILSVGMDVYFFISGLGRWVLQE